MKKQSIAHSSMVTTSRDVSRKVSKAKKAPGTEARRSEPLRARESAPARVRYAVVGLGHIAQVAVLPAFRSSRNSELRALVSGDPRKLRAIAKKYRVPISVGYGDYDRLLESGEIDAVYIALPNHLHREYAVRAAQKGIHILCEKPMAVTTADAEPMLRAARAARVKLMIAYRLHFQEANLKAIELVQSGKLGDIRYFNSSFSMQVQDGNVRTQTTDGGGPIHDIGIYCLNAARYLMRDEPTEVTAFGTRYRDPRFRKILDSVSVSLRFPGERLASFVCSFSSAPVARYQITGTRGSLEVEDAYGYVEPTEFRLNIGGKKSHRKFAIRDQFAAELVHFSDCVRNDREPRPSGEEGLADMRVIDAIYRSIKLGKSVPVRAPARSARLKRPQLRQAIARPFHREPKLVNVKPPARES